MNDSSYRAVSKWLKHWRSRQALKHARTKLLCTNHGLQTVADYQPLAKTVTLACSCRREIFHRSDDEIFAYELAKIERAGRQAVRTIGTEDDTDREHNWRHAKLEVEEIAAP
jgi:hypothetical protein